MFLGLPVVQNIHAADGGGADAAISRSPCGVFVLIGRNVAYPSTTLLSKPNYSGIFFNRNWDSVEPQPGIFDWSEYDRIVQDALEYGKQVVLGVHQGLLGDGFPEWLSVPMFSCSDGSVGAIPWHPTFHVQYRGMLTQLVSRYGQHPAVVGFVVEGHYNWLSDDLSMCQKNAVDRQHWIELGYTRQLMHGAAFDLYVTVAALTDKYIRVPAANNMMNETTGNFDMPSTQQYIVDPLYAQYGDRAGMGATTFTNATGDPAQQYNTTALSRPYAVFYNHTPEIWGQRLPPNQGGPNDTASFLTMVNIAIDYGVRFFEIGADQVTKFASAVSCLNHVLLTQSGEHCME
jgi:Beta-galactosidase